MEPRFGSEPTSVAWRAMQPADLPAVRRLLETADLPADDLAIADGTVGLVTGGPERITAAGALEIHGRYGLLRSIVVDPEHRSRGLGSSIVRRLLTEASARDLRQIWLLTETAAPFFAELGFERTDRTSAPRAIQRSSEFAELCPASAVAMVLETSAAGATAPT